MPARELSLGDGLLDWLLVQLGELQAVGSDQFGRSGRSERPVVMVHVHAGRYVLDGIHQRIIRRRPRIVAAVDADE